MKTTPPLTLLTINNNSESWNIIGYHDKNGCLHF